MQFSLARRSFIFYLALFFLDVFRHKIIFAYALKHMRGFFARIYTRIYTVGNRPLVSSLFAFMALFMAATMVGAQKLYRSTHISIVPWGALVCEKRPYFYYAWYLRGSNA